MSIHLELVKEQIAGSRLRAGPVDAKAAGDHIAVIASTLRRLDDMLQGLLRFTRPEELKLQPASLAAMIEAIMPIVSAEARKTGVEVQVDCPPDLPMLRADPAMLQQALQNLALNACQAMPGGGASSWRAAPGTTAWSRSSSRHRRRDRARAPRQDLQPLLHHPGRRQRNRAVDGLPDRAVARRRDRSAVVARKRNGVQAAAARRLMGDNRLMSRLACAVVVAFALAASACASAQAKGDAGGPRWPPCASAAHDHPRGNRGGACGASRAAITRAGRAQPPARRRVAKPDKPAEKPDPPLCRSRPRPRFPRRRFRRWRTRRKWKKTIRARTTQASRDLERTDYARSIPSGACSTTPRSGSSSRLRTR